MTAARSGSPDAKTFSLASSVPDFLTVTPHIICRPSAMCARPRDRRFSSGLLDMSDAAPELATDGIDVLWDFSRTDEGRALWQVTPGSVLTTLIPGGQRNHSSIMRNTNQIRTGNESVSLVAGEHSTRPAASSPECTSRSNSIFSFIRVCVAEWRKMMFAATTWRTG
jgi:hypothetical protein